MSNDDVYAAGLLNRALEPATQPPEIQAFLSAEIGLLQELIPLGGRALDIGCGTGRHLLLLADHLKLGVGVDYERTYIADARRRTHVPHIYFLTADAAAIPIVSTFDLALCLTNTWGTMSDKVAVLNEMRRLAPTPGTRFLSVYSTASIAPRSDWYRRLGHTVLDHTPEYLMTEGGFRSEHFSEGRLRSIVGPCTIRPLTLIAHAVHF
jgi:SAM-dependent methyltransferase